MSILQQSNVIGETETITNKKAPCMWGFFLFVYKLFFYSDQSANPSEQKVFQNNTVLLLNIPV